MNDYDCVVLDCLLTGEPKLALASLVVSAPTLAVLNQRFQRSSGTAVTVSADVGLPRRDCAFFSLDA